MQNRKNRLSVTGALTAISPQFSFPWFANALPVPILQIHFFRGARRLGIAASPRPTPVPFCRCCATRQMALLVHFSSEIYPGRTHKSAQVRLVANAVRLFVIQ